METILNNLSVIKQRIHKACLYSNRNPNDVRLLLATKTVNSDRIVYAIKQGELLIGENKVQELKQKYNDITHLHPEIHFIGHLQTNKIKDVIKWASCIESIDRISLAQKLQQRLEFENKEIDVFIQVNTSFEESKFGVSPENTIALIKEVATLKNIHIKGLMTIGILSSNTNEVRRCFQLLRKLRDQIEAMRIPNIEMKELSMGMSSDLEIAIEEGATIVRVGTAIFGERTYPDSYYWDESKAIR